MGIRQKKDFCIQNIVFGSKIFWFGGQFRELESPKVWLMAEIFIFEGHKHAKSLQLIKRFPAMFSEISYLISA